MNRPTTRVDAQQRRYWERRAKALLKKYKKLSTKKERIFKKMEKVIEKTRSSEGSVWAL